MTEYKMGQVDPASIGLVLGFNKSGFKRRQHTVYENPTAVQGQDYSY